MKEREGFSSNPSLKPSAVYKANLGKMRPDQFASGNRTGVGVTANAMRIILLRAKREQRSKEGIDKRSKEVKTQMRELDKQGPRKLEDMQRGAFLDISKTYA